MGRLRSPLDGDQSNGMTDLLWRDGCSQKRPQKSPDWAGLQMSLN
jgi:hypothetical protein